LKYTIEGVIGRYPAVNIGVLVGRGLRIDGTSPELGKYKADAVRVAVEKVDAAPIGQHPYIASWREMYRSFGAKPADYHPSSEALARRVVKTRELPTINASVDAYNAVSVRHLIPIGGFDTDRVEGDIRLRLSPGGEPFNGLGVAEVEQTRPGEVVYADDRRILTRRWNFRDCVETQITTETRSLVMFIDGSPEIPRSEVESVLVELASAEERFCGGTYSTAVADAKRPVVMIV